MTELALTRIFSVVMYYHFAFLAISIALFGVSASGVFAYVTRRRLEYTTGLFAELGFDATAARDRALLAYAAYVGHVVLRRAAKSQLPRGAAEARYLAHVAEALVGPSKSRKKRP